MPTLEISESCLQQLNALAQNKHVSVEAYLETHVSNYTALGQGDLADTMAFALDTAKLGIWEFDIATQKHTWSQQQFEIYGVKPEELSHDDTTWRSLIHPDDIEHVNRQIEKTLTSDDTVVYTFRIIRPDGQLRYISASGRAQTDDDGNIFKVIGIDRDVTELEITKQSLGEREANYRAIAENFPNGIVGLYNHDLIYTFINGERLSTSVAQSLLGKKLRDVFPPEVYERDEPALLAALEGKKTDSLVQYDGEYFRVITLPVHDDTGHIVSGMVMSQNVSELKQAEIQQRHLASKLELAMETAHLGMWEHAITDDSITWNKKQFEIYGVTPENFANDATTWLSLIHPDDLEYVKGVTRSIYALKNDVQYTYRIIRPDGKLRYIHASSIAIHDDDGHTTKIIGIDRDITDLKMAEIQQQDFVQRLALAIETVQLGIWELDIATNKLIWNAQQHEIYGITPEEFAQDMDSWRALVHPDDADYANQRFEAIMTEHQVSNVEFRIVRRDGDIRYINASGTVQHDEDGNIVTIIGINQDVTEIKQAQRKLEASESRYRALFNNARNPVAIYDENARIVMVNDRAAANFGVTQAEAVGKMLGDFFPDLHQMTVDRIQQALASNKLLYFEDHVEVQGQDRWYWSAVQPVFSLDESNRHVQIISHDITERKEAERALRESEEQHRRLYDSVPIGLFQTSIEGQIIRANQGLVRLLGYPDMTTLLATPAEDLFANTIDQNNLLNASDGHAFFHPRIRRFDGSSFEAEVIVQVYYDEDGSIRLFEGAMQDVTQRREAEKVEAERLQLGLQLEKERELAKYKANLLSILAHEFRTPLTVIMSSSELLSHYDDKLTEEQKKRRFNNILEQVSLLDNLIDEVTTLSRADMGTTIYKPKIVNVEVMCQNILSELRDITHYTHEVYADINMDVPYVTLDEKLMHRALSNLMTNAIKYSPNGGKIELIVQTYETEVHFTVKDQGMGIPLKDQANLFTQFHRASNVGSIRGTGLGLAITKLAAEQHGGTVSFESWVGKGSTFTIRLPLDPQVS